MTQPIRPCAVAKGRESFANSSSVSIVSKNAHMTCMAVAAVHMLNGSPAPSQLELGGLCW